MQKPEGKKAIDALDAHEATYLWGMFEKILIALQDAPPYCLIALGSDLLSFGMFNGLHAVRTPAQREELAASCSNLIAGLQKSLEQYQAQYDMDHVRLEAQSRGAVATVTTSSRVH